MSFITSMQMRKLRSYADNKQPFTFYGTIEPLRWSEHMHWVFVTLQVQGGSQKLLTNKPTEQEQAHVAIAIFKDKHWLRRPLPAQTGVDLYMHGFVIDLHKATHNFVANQW